MEDFVVRHVQDDESIGEDSLPLHCQPLHPGPREARQDEALLLLLNSLDLLLDELGHDLILDDGVVLEVGLDLLAELLLLGDLLLEQVAD